jgi:hypothetical protein
MITIEHFNPSAVFLKKKRKTLHISVILKLIDFQNQLHFQRSRNKIYEAQIHVCDNYIYSSINWNVFCTSQKCTLCVVHL